MGNSKIERSTVNDRLNKWVERNPDPRFNFEMDDSELNPELDLLDKSPFKLSKKPPNNKKKKDWILESKWISKEQYNLFEPPFFKNKDGFTTEWGNTYRFTTRFISISAAKNHFTSLKKDEWWSSTKGREWRIRNEKKGEIKELQTA
jgi:hypothetical protein